MKICCSDSGRNINQATTGGDMYGRVIYINVSGK